MEKIDIGIIGGSGLYHMPGLKNPRRHAIDTPFGRPSATIISGELAGRRVAFLARHGEAHALLPSEVPYRANIYALKQLGVKYLLAFSAVGSLSEAIAPLHMVTPDQYIDMTKQRHSSFFGAGVVAHVSMAHPVCSALSQQLASAVARAAPAVTLHHHGTYVCIEGPQFSSLAESRWYQSMGADIIGMTAQPEAKLAREAQIAYASLGMVTDYDCWRPQEANVTTGLAIANLQKNAGKVPHIVAEAVANIAATQPSSEAHMALKQGLVTPLDSMSPPEKSLVETLLA